MFWFGGRNDSRQRASTGKRPSRDRSAPSSRPPWRPRLVDIAGRQWRMQQLGGRSGSGFWIWGSSGNGNRTGGERAASKGRRGREGAATNFPARRGAARQPARKRDAAHGNGGGWSWVRARGEQERCIDEGARSSDGRRTRRRSRGDASPDDRPIDARPERSRRIKGGGRVRGVCWSNVWGRQDAGEQAGARRDDGRRARRG